MGNLSHFNLKEYIEEHDLRFLIETGTWHGAAVDYALKFGFEKIYTIELLKEYYEGCVERFKDNDNVVLINDNSVEGLIKILKENTVGNCLYWLDAHLPDFYDKSYGSDYKNNKEILIPLEEELRVIVENKDVSNDVFIIDDLRIYKKGPFQKGEWHGAINVGLGGTDFINDLLGKTHNKLEIYDDEGYILCTPKIILL